MHSECYCSFPEESELKLVSRDNHVEDTVVRVGGISIGGGNFTVIAGPCSVESEEQLNLIASAVKEAGAVLLRGGAFKPRTSPYSFQGLREAGIELLIDAGRRAKLPVVTEIMSPDKVKEYAERVDMIQVGARNMQNFELLKELGKVKTPVLLKRGMAATVEEWLFAAEYIMKSGNNNVVLCERGIRTFEHFTRNTLDLSSVLAVKHESHLPVLVDPSHASGLWWMVAPLAKAALAAGADGIMVEVHNDPPNALCDGDQALTLQGFSDLMDDLEKIAPVVGKKM